MSSAVTSLRNEQSHTLDRPCPRNRASSPSCYRRTGSCWCNTLLASHRAHSTRKVLIRTPQNCFQKALPHFLPSLLFSVWVSDRRMQEPNLPPPPSSPIRIFPRPKLFPIADAIGTSRPDWASRLLPLPPAASRHFVAVDKPGGVPVRTISLAH